MVCIARSPRCSGADAPAVPEALTDIAAALGLIAVLGAAIISIAAGLGAVSVSGGVLTIGGLSIGTAAGAGLGAAFVGALVVGTVILLSWFDRCRSQLAPPACVAGVVVDLADSFSSAWDEILPFTAQHDRVDLVAKSSFWDLIESGDARVFCTGEPFNRKSEIIRCYFFEARVCAAARGAAISLIAGIPAGTRRGARGRHRDRLRHRHILPAGTARGPVGGGGGRPRRGLPRRPDRQGPERPVDAGRR